MSFNHRKLGTIACLLAAGCGNDGPTAGGQSGTDADGGYHCTFNFEQPTGEPVALDEPVKTGLSPNDYYARLDGTFAFACKDGTKYSASVTRGDAARRVLGLLNGGTPNELCEGLQLDAEIHVETDDGGWSYDASFLTANLLGGYEIGGSATDAERRELRLMLKEKWTPQNDGPIDTLRLDRPLTSTTYCDISPGEGGSGGSGEGGSSGSD
jgi:hypothetical protein